MSSTTDQFWTTIPGFQEVCPEGYEVLERCYLHGYQVTYVENVAGIKRFFPAKYDVVHFCDNNGQPLPYPEFQVLRKCNGIVVNAGDPLGSMRPGGRGFFVLDHEESRMPKISEQFENLDSEMVIQESMRWLANRNLIVFGCRVGGGLLHNLTITPERSAWQFLAAQTIHNDMMSVEDLRSNKLDGVYLGIPGLRYQLFDGQQCTNFDRRDKEGRPWLIISPSSYQGLFPGVKKPVFVQASAKLVAQGGFLHHATMVEVTVGLSADRKKLVFIISARSGDGKTEGRTKLLRSGENNDSATIAKGVEGHRDIVLHYPMSEQPHLTCAGDDGLILKTVKANENGRGYAENMEKGGCFDRPSDSFKEGDLPENDQINRMLEQDPQGTWKALHLNKAPKPGQPITTWERTMFDGKPHSNPRENITWEALRATGVDVTTEELEFGVWFHNAGQMQENAILSPGNLLPWRMMAIAAIVGWTRGKSKSVQPGKHDSAMISDFAATVGVFSSVPNVDLANAIWRQCESMWGVRYLWIPIGFCGPNYKVGHNMERFMRDALALELVGKAKIDWGLSESPLLGKRPHRLEFLGQELPAEFLAPIKSFGSSDYYEICQTVRDFHVDHLNDVIHHPRCDAGLKEAVEYFAEMPMGPLDESTRQEIFDWLEHRKS